MACGCTRNRQANQIPARTINPSQQPNQLTPTTNINVNPGTLSGGTNVNNTPRTMINSDRVRIERLRREAIAKSKGN
jgi:hypothetical protein